MMIATNTHIPAIAGHMPNITSNLNMSEMRWENRKKKGNCRIELICCLEKNKKFR